jgi:hypothetical protein
MDSASSSLGDPATSVLRAGLRAELRPIARVLLKSGVSYREFADLAKLTYVEVATREFGIRGRPTNISRVAILTGFTRREARRLRDVLDVEGPAPAASLSTASRVLAGWHEDPDFVDATGSPKLLVRDGATASFAELARRYGADVPPTALLKELRTAGALEVTPDDRVRVLLRSFVPPNFDAAMARLWGVTIADLATTASHNVVRAPNEVARFERRAVNTRLKPRALPMFRDLLRAAGQAFLERMDSWLTRHEASPDEPSMRVGVHQIEGRKDCRGIPL